MLSMERYQTIISELEKYKIVKVTQLANNLGVTEKTIRIDLESLEKRGLLKRVHGGAILLEAEGKLLPIDERQSAHNETKRAIAKEAIKLIKPNDTILMDGGSTTKEICKMLGDFPVSIITNDLKIANMLDGKDNVQLIVLGGTRIPKSSSLIGAQATELLKQLRVNRLFFGTTGVSITHGLTVFNSLHADWKKQIIKSADHVTLVADSSKFEKVALVRFASFTEIDEIITDSHLNEQLKEKMNNYNVSVKIASI
ncbi:DeoR/GlpR family DNA-binding transcription regulator [Aquibacillus rhizosphaerae]|uniref:DeoR/GlpR family DNA-binding transcription regulator n=1 Tax=Aquibacillus rhizosphaerae TaxID=3051431 RepID=A0ABT7L365_9BACI|nr:DeoR/GlpR family DNA-binding transcription regulator [Aquibacillus sp. LR5S19]MDL4840308.1 DeoR/GlpR family DNA-binding transcription regulator [Aquibacillus sp. LR5S19]